MVLGEELAVRNFLEMGDLAPAELEKMLAKAAGVKHSPAAFSTALAGKSLAYYSEKPSTRSEIGALPL